MALDAFKPAVIPSYKGKKGWASLFGTNDGCGEFISVGSETYPDSYWHRIEYDEFTFFAHAESANGKLRSEHRHLDLGGFVLYYAGQPIFLDCGRSDYTHSKFSDYGYSAHSHNTLFVNGLSAEVNGPSWLQSAYRRISVNTKLSEMNDSVLFVIKHNGFDRISNLKISHERKFIFGSDFFEIEDKLIGDKSCHLCLCFHYSPEVNNSKNEISDIMLEDIGATFHVDNRLKQRVVSGRRETPVGGLFSPEYGVINQCTTMSVDGLIKLPATIKNRLSLRL